MIEVYKIITGKYDALTAPKTQIIRAHSTVTRGNTLRLEKAEYKYGLSKYNFTTCSFKSQLQKHWIN